MLVMVRFGTRDGLFIREQLQMKLQVNEANEGFKKMKWSRLPSEWKNNEWLTMKTGKNKKIRRNAFANDDGWMTNDEQRVQNLLLDSYNNNTIFWMVG